MKTVLWLICVGLFILPGWAEPTFEQSVEALRSGNDRKTLEITQALDKAHKSSFGSFYNQGIAWRNLGDLPQARASFEHALLLRPHDLPTRRRLREVERGLGQKVVALDVRCTPWWGQSQAEALIVLPGIFLLGLALRARWQGRGLTALPTSLVWFGGLGLIGVIAMTSPATQRAVVIDKSVQLLPAAAPDSPGETVPGGVLVEVLEHRDHYLKVSLGDGKTGWLRSAQIRPLETP